MSHANELNKCKESTVLITGAGSGFGKALALEFSDAGWQVIALVHRDSQVDSLHYSHARIYSIVGDVTTKSCTKSIINAIESVGGNLTVLINNAGNPGGHPINPIDPEQITRLFMTHCIGTVRCSKACLPYLSKSSNGWIVNISSRLGSLQRNADREFAMERRSYAYRIAKAALNMATLCMAQDDMLAKIQVVAIHPGQMSTKIGIPDAPHTAEESAKILVARLLRSDFQTGHFYDLYDGEIPW